MDDLQKITAWLDSVRGTWPAVSEASGVNLWWIYKFMAGKIPNPGHDKIENIKRVMKNSKAA